MTEGRKGFDLGTLLMVLVLLCILVAGLWMTGKALDSRLDELNTRITSRTDLIQNDIDALRTEIRAVLASQAVGASPETEAKEAPAKKSK
jgi:outer membrane murein-binding lipoprotein Lpp